MRTHLSAGLVLLAALGTAACGVPKSQYDAAVADGKKSKDQADADEKQINDLKARVTELQTRINDLEGKQTGDEQTRKELEELRAQKAAIEARAKLFDDFVKKFKTMIDAGKLDITTRHGQIVLALATDVLFDPGKTDLKPGGKSALAEVAAALKSVAGRRFQVAGHTDTLPIRTKEFPSNWELSTARAVAVVKLLVAQGVKPEALSAAGYAEFDPAQSNATEGGRSKNRRIEIVLVPNIEELVKMPELKPQEAAPRPEKPEERAAPKPTTPAHPATHPALKGPKPAPKKK